MSLDPMNPKISFDLLASLYYVIGSSESSTSFELLAPLDDVIWSKLYHDDARVGYRLHCRINNRLSVQRSPNTSPMNTESYYESSVIIFWSIGSIRLCHWIQCIQWHHSINWLYKMLSLDPMNPVALLDLLAPLYDVIGSNESIGIIWSIGSVRWCHWIQ